MTKRNVVFFGVNKSASEHRQFTALGNDIAALSKQPCQIVTRTSLRLYDVVVTDESGRVLCIAEQVDFMYNTETAS